MKSLHDLPRFSDRWSYLFLEYGTLDQDASGLCFHNQAGSTELPVNQVGLIMLGPGTTITAAAVKILAGNNCLVAWVGEHGVRLYAHSTGGTFSASRLIRQAALASDAEQRLAVAKRMYQKRFADGDLDGKSIEQIRGMEGARVRSVYQLLAKQHGIDWTGRNYDQGDWNRATPANRALSAANACLYGICHAAIVSAGYSAGLGFIHVGKLLSFVYDIADLYKTELTVPIAFRLAAAGTANLERHVRLACRDLFFETKFLERILPDIAEVLDAGDDLGESPGELEGRAVSMAVGNEAGSVPWEWDGEDSRLSVEDGL